MWVSTGNGVLWSLFLNTAGVGLGFGSGAPGCSCCSTEAGTSTLLFLVDERLNAAAEIVRGPDPDAGVSASDDEDLCELIPDIRLKSADCDE